MVRIWSVPVEKNRSKKRRAITFSIIKFHHPRTGLIRVRDTIKTQRTCTPFIVSSSVLLGFIWLLDRFYMKYSSEGLLFSWVYVLNAFRYCHLFHAHTITIFFDTIAHVSGCGFNVEMSYVTQNFWKEKRKRTKCKLRDCCENISCTATYKWGLLFPFSSIKSIELYVLKDVFT